ncbi:MAG: hypothetical protein ACP5VR_09960 [Acidimicrobiales bacterium]
MSRDRPWSYGGPSSGETRLASLRYGTAKTVNHLRPPFSHGPNEDVTYIKGTTDKQKEKMLWH